MLIVKYYLCTIGKTVCYMGSAIQGWLIIKCWSEWKDRQDFWNCPVISCYKNNKHKTYYAKKVSKQDRDHIKVNVPRPIPLSLLYIPRFFSAERM